MAENVLCEHSSNSGTEIEYVGRHELLECLVCHQLSAAVNMFTAEHADVLIKNSIACNSKGCYFKLKIGQTRIKLFDRKVHTAQV